MEYLRSMHVCVYLFVCLCVCVFMCVCVCVCLCVCVYVCLDGWVFVRPTSINYAQANKRT